MWCVRTRDLLRIGLPGPPLPPLDEKLQLQPAMTTATHPPLPMHDPLPASSQGNLQGVSSDRRRLPLSAADPKVAMLPVVPGPHPTLNRQMSRFPDSWEGRVPRPVGIFCEFNPRLHPRSSEDSCVELHDSEPLHEAHLATLRGLLLSAVSPRLEPWYSFGNGLARATGMVCMYVCTSYMYVST